MALNIIKTEKAGEIIAPSVHMNGTSRESLTGQYHQTAQAVIAAANVISANGPNARDYYIQGSEAFSRAQKEHRARYDALAAVYVELIAIYEALDV